jgi:hypothetical protein
VQEAEEKGEESKKADGQEAALERRGDSKAKQKEDEKDKRDEGEEEEEEDATDLELQQKIGELVTSMVEGGGAQDDPLKISFLDFACDPLPCVVVTLLLLEQETPFLVCGAF